MIIAKTVSNQGHKKDDSCTTCASAGKMEKEVYGGKRCERGARQPRRHLEARQSTEATDSKEARASTRMSMEARSTKKHKGYQLKANEGGIN